MSSVVYLGIEGGGTKSTAISADRELNIIDRAEFGPGNVRLLNTEALVTLFREVARALPPPLAIGIGLAGVRTTEDRARVEAAAREVWRNSPVIVTHDLQIALRAAAENHRTAERVLIVSGTGSCCYGEGREGKTAKVGGWGHILGDVGSGYDIAMRALRGAVFEYDRTNRWTALGVSLLRAAMLNSPEDLIPWIQSADKAAIAQLAPAVFAAAKRDALAKRILAQVASDLARDGSICARRLARGRNTAMQFVLAGSVLRQQPFFARRVAHLLRSEWPKARVVVLDQEGAIGAVRMAIEAADKQATERPPTTQVAGGSPIYVPRFDPRQSPTEQRNPRSARLDQLSIRRAVELMLDAESEVVPALRREQKAIEAAVRLSSEALARSGRIFYVGAGTSGRLGVLDASECPPTFRVAPEMVQGIIAGGQSALWRAVEGAEDDSASGVAALTARNVTAKDVVIGIAASGRTPFVWGAFEEARRIGAGTVLLCFNPHLQIDRGHKPDVVIAPNLGPEILTGSTRLKCGTATKLVLNMITTVSMVRLGKVVSNLMVDLNPSNVKLRDRAIRIVCELQGCSALEAKKALERQRWVVKDALRSLQTREQARP